MNSSFERWKVHSILWHPSPLPWPEGTRYLGVLCARPRRQPGGLASRPPSRCSSHAVAARCPAQRPLAGPGAHPPGSRWAAPGGALPAALYGVERGRRAPLRRRFPLSPPRTGQARFRASGGPIRLPYGIFAASTPRSVHGSLLLPVPLSIRPVCLDPFALCPAFPDSLGGRHATDYYGSAAPPSA